jgi:transcriptional regulator GlxA family with amidase domain
MGKSETSFDAFSTQSQTHADHAVQRSFEFLLSKGFNALELASATGVLATANDILGCDAFNWRFVSHTPGLLSGATGIIVRAEPAVYDHGYSDLMIVVGGKIPWSPDIRKRARSMQKLGRPVVLLSDAATAYIRGTKRPSGNVTTHWRDVPALAEAGHHPNLTTRFSEYSDGIITAAGGGATAELIIGLIAPLLDGADVAELGNRLLLHTIRKSTAEQPQNLTDNEGLFGTHVTLAIRQMEQSIADPLSIADLASAVSVSPRHLERVFRGTFNETPARFYKRLRTKRARVMIEETVLPIVEIAAATGFQSSTALAKAIREEFGLTPSRMRVRTTIELTEFPEA